MIEVEIQDEVLDYIRKCAPDPRKRFKEALQRLKQEEGDIKPLTHELEGFYRLRVGKYRVVFRYLNRKKHRVIQCVYAGERSWIYEVFHSRIYRE